MSRSQVPVVVVGAGPTGLAVATLLGWYGVECLVLERRQPVCPQPRAVHLDDEVYRILAWLGVREEFAAISRPCLGMRLVDRELRPLAEFERASGVGVHGYPEANMYDQPELEALLCANLTRFPGVTLRSRTEVTGLDQRDDGAVTVRITDRATGERDVLRAGYVLGCDGANSRTRSWIGAAMRDLGSAQRWLVADVVTDADLGQWEGAHQVCDPARAAAYMRIGPRRYRWEFRLGPGDVADDYRDMARLSPLIAPWTGTVPAGELQLVRVAEYTFRAQVADHWRDRRVFLLGDAAHLTPPFIGQGLGAGLRDAANLSWKLAAVLCGSLPEAVLDTYQSERKPHARALIRMAKLVGSAMTQGGDLGNVLRRSLLPRLVLLPWLPALALRSETPALRRSALVRRPRLRRGLAGSLCPNAPLDPADPRHRFDDLAQGRFALVTTERPAEALCTEVRRRGAALVVAGPGTALHRWLRGGGARAAVVRPDGTVLCTARAAFDVCLNLPALKSPPVSPPPG
ncbi:bifunctional 3-(3-hydroxy-phenyl)propionate/3-hydroxycinnamic acid hydroxylase MhpA [Streptomyces sp. NY05-11A]|uniref:bifunctional 3-(3-hydroxy-phenyl)propionate/3-hydroxycinnamic acid hydroxylase MhpA n=1 Tax=Streptomyces soliscabiei TaxID=588897 RepID=UPI0029B2DD4F|nr:bifunctional 3-(3-hydroxy-phenyl)propionate/3-hydroxycinnamic acid hydroxylase [Streptomyces sp. NY05-11A]MDX2678861.1 bifunctional 3-(3-hydroxy-phenyl)propionate/3-hydroxycinnamic acid hydroxylase [Streptomyces sp. NY05-11A]